MAGIAVGKSKGHAVTMREKKPKTRQARDYGSVGRAIDEPLRESDNLLGSCLSVRF